MSKVTKESILKDKAVIMYETLNKIDNYILESTWNEKTLDIVRTMVIDCTENILGTMLNKGTDLKETSNSNY